MQLINYSRQSINKSDEKKVLNVLRSDFLTTGPVGIDFEKKVSRFLNCKYSISVNSATSGLHLSCKALDINNLSDTSLVAPYKLIGFDALSVDKAIIFFTLFFIAARTIFSAPMIFVFINSVGLYSAAGTCFNAAACTR